MKAINPDFACTERESPKNTISRGRWVGWILGALLLAQPAWAAEVGADNGGMGQVIRVVGLGLAAAAAVAFSVLGASYAVGRIGAAALGAAAEKPELLTRSLIFVALAEGLAVLGFALAMVLIQKM
jgi:V/A-type H+-transporting ATPase subunit K